MADTKHKKEHVRAQLEEVDKDTVSATDPSYNRKLNIADSGGPKDEAIAGGKPPFDPNPGPFEDQQNPKRPIGEYTAEGQPPLQKK